MLLVTLVAKIWRLRLSLMEEQKKKDKMDLLTLTGPGRGVATM